MHLYKMGLFGVVSMETASMHPNTFDMFLIVGLLKVLEIGFTKITGHIAFYLCSESYVSS